MIDETGDRKDGHKTAHVSRQYLANLGKIDNGVVSVSSLWADERVYYPIDVEPSTPAPYFREGKKDPACRTKRHRLRCSWCNVRSRTGCPFERWWPTRSMGKIAGSEVDYES